jgi:hypothetical protein
VTSRVGADGDTGRDGAALDGRLRRFPRPDGKRYPSAGTLRAGPPGGPPSARDDGPPAATFRWVRSREVTTPAGERWRVGRLWAPRIGGETVSARARRFRRDHWRRTRDTLDASDALDGVGCVFDLLDAVVWFGVAVLVVILVLFLVPLLAGVVELLLLLVLIAGSVVAKVAFRRPWVVEAEAVEGPREGRLVAWRVVGWRASGQQVADVVRALEAGLGPPPGAVEGRAHTRPSG